MPTQTAPVLTPEMRDENLRKAAEARRKRKLLKENLHNGKIDFVRLLNGDTSQVAEDSIAVLNKSRVKQLLRALPGIGVVRADQIMAELEIADNRRFGGLGVAQRRRLAESLS